jgi:hypothetical protein
MNGKYLITMDRGGPPVPGAIMGGYGQEKPAAFF